MGEIVDKLQNTIGILDFWKKPIEVKNRFEETLKDHIAGNYWNGPRWNGIS